MLTTAEALLLVNRDETRRNKLREDRRNKRKNVCLARIQLGLPPTKDDMRKFPAETLEGFRKNPAKFILRIKGGQEEILTCEQLLEKIEIWPHVANYFRKLDEMRQKQLPAPWKMGILIVRRNYIPATLTLLP